MYKSGGGWDVQPPRKLIPKFSICAQRTYEEYHSILFYGGTRDFASEFFMFAFVLPRYVNNDQTSISVGYKLYTYHIHVYTSGFYISIIIINTHHINQTLFRKLKYCFNLQISCFMFRHQTV